MILRAVQGAEFVVELWSDGHASYNGERVKGLRGPVVHATAGHSHYTLHGERGELYWCRGTQATLVQCKQKVVSSACGYMHTTAALQDGTVRMHSKRKWLRVPLPGRAVRVFSGNGSSAALLDDGSLYTWGRNESQQLGHASMPGPARVTLPGKVADFGFGMGFSCALLTDGRLYAWGFRSTPRPAAMDKRMRFSRLAVGWGFIAAAHQDRTYVSMHGTVSGVPVERYVQRENYAVSALVGGWATTNLRAEFFFDAPARPTAIQPLELHEYRWMARRVLVLCVAREQARRPRKRSRACADGAWSNKLPPELWHEVARYLG